MRAKQPAWVWTTLAVVGVLALLADLFDVPVLGGFGRFLLLLFATLLLGWLLVKLGRRLLWRVGRRLALTYLLLGVLPIPMVIALVFVAAYLLSGFFLGHLYRQAANHLEAELSAAASTRLAAVRLRTPVPAAATPEFGFAYYREGLRVGGDERAPAAWPLWLEAASSAGKSRVLGAPGSEPGALKRDELPPLVALDDGRLTIAATARREDYGVVAFLDGDLKTHLRERSDVWVELFTDDDPNKETLTTVSLLGESFVFQPLGRTAGSEERYQYLAANGGERGVPIIGFELAGPVRRLADGGIVSSSVSTTLTATPEIIFRRLFSSSAKIDTAAWLAFFIPAFLLFDVYAIAALMAILMILGLTRAVNRLSAATAAVRAGDFSTRIPVKRKDQLGELQASFNEMSENLERLVKDAAQKEVLQRELDIAQEVQKSLLPSDLKFHHRSVEFATHFEPSATIAGDYFDIVELEGPAAGRLAIVVADVSGHGLSSGLRMAMLKAGLLTLVHEGKQPDGILISLDRLMRSSNDHRSFATAMLAVVDLERATLHITNAGHPPTYLVRDGNVEEILIQGTPLGALNVDFGHRALDLCTGDVVLWLSDGVVEATNDADEPFGYAATEAALRGPAARAADVRDRLLEAVRKHTCGRPPEDDRTVVAMRWRGEAGG